VLIRVWSAAYRTQSGEVDISTTAKRKVHARKSRVSLKKWEEIIQESVALGLFSPEFFKKNLLTSNGIQKRISKVASDRERGRARKSNKTNESGEFSTGETRGKPRDNRVDSATKGKGNTEREKEKESIKGSGASAPAPDKPPPKVKPVFVKPTPDECVQHFRDKGYIDPENEGRKFWNWYEQTDWRVGKKRIPMTLWPLAASNWNIKNKQDQVSGRYVKHNEIHPKHNPGLARAQHTVTPDRVAEITRQREERHRQRDQSDAARGRDAPAHVGH
jgi:hypothetical protein